MTIFQLLNNKKKHHKQMINIDYFRIILSFIPYDNWIDLRLVCNDWNEAVISLCSSSHIVNFANGFTDDEQVDVSKISTAFTYAFNSDHSSRELALSFYAYENRVLPFRQNSQKTTSEHKNKYRVDTIAGPLIRLFNNIEELTINASLYEAIFNRPQCGVLDLGQASNLKTLNIVNHSLDKPQIRKIPRSVRHLNFIGVTVLSRPFRKVAVRFLESISFRYFVGEKEMIRDFTPNHITLYFEHHLGTTQWPIEHDQIIEYAEEMKQQYSIQTHKTPFEGYMGPNFTLYACLEGIDFLNNRSHYNNADDHYRLIDYCFVEKRFPIEIEHLFFLASKRCIHDRLFHLLHIAQNNGQIERLKKQGTIHLERSSFLLKLFEIDSTVGLEIINKFGFDPNITENRDRTMCSIKDVSPLLFQFLLISDFFQNPNLISQYSNAINDPELYFDFTRLYKGFSMARWAMALGRKDMMIYYLNHGSTLNHELSFESIEEAAPLHNIVKSPIEQLVIWTEYESPHVVWNALQNDPISVGKIAYCVRNNYPIFMSNLFRIADNLGKSLIDVLNLESKKHSHPSNLSKDDISSKSFFETTCTHAGYFRTKEVTKKIMIWLNKEKAKDPVKGRELSQQLLGKDEKFNNNRYMAHVLADIELTAYALDLFLEALRQMPSLDEPDIDGTPTVFHHISLGMLAEISKWIMETKSSEKSSSDDQDLAQRILKLILTTDKNGFNPIEPYHMIRNKFLLPQISNLHKILHTKNKLGLTPTQVACLEGTFSSFKQIVNLHLDSFSDDLWEELLCPIDDPNDPEIKYSLFALSSIGGGWWFCDSLFDLALRYADFSLLTPDNASLLHAFSIDEGKTEYFRIVLDRCLEANIDINLQTIQRKQTALHLFAEKRKLEEFNILIEHGADATGVRDLTGRSPFSQANLYQKLSYIRYLKKQCCQSEPTIHGVNASDTIHFIILDLVRDMIDLRKRNVESICGDLEEVMEIDILDILEIEITYYDVYHESNCPFFHTMESLDHELSENQSEAFVNGRKAIRMDFFSWMVYLGNTTMSNQIWHSCNFKLIERIDPWKSCRLLWHHLWEFCVYQAKQHHQEIENCNESKEGLGMSNRFKREKFSFNLKYQTLNWKNSVLQKPGTWQASYWEYLSSPSFIASVDKTHSKPPIFFGSWIERLRKWTDIPVQKILFTYDDLNSNQMKEFGSNSNIDMDSQNNSHHDTNNNNYYNENLKEENTKTGSSQNQSSLLLCNKMTTMHLLFILKHWGNLEYFLKMNSAIPKHALSHEPLDEWKRSPLDMIDLPFASSLTTRREGEHQSISKMKQIYKSKFDHFSKKRKHFPSNDNNSEDSNKNKRNKRRKLNHSSSSEVMNDIVDISSQRFKNKTEMKSRTRIKDLQRYLRLYGIQFKSNERKASLADKVWYHYNS